MNRRLPPSLCLAFCVGLCAALLIAALPLAARAQTDDMRRTAEQLRENPRSVNLRVRLVTLHHLLGTEQLKAGNAAAAIRTFGAGVAVADEPGYALAPTHPVSLAVHYGAGDAHYSRGQYDAAIAALEPVAAPGPLTQKVRYLLGLALAQQGAPANRKRGLEMLQGLAVEGRGPMSAMAERAAARWTYNAGAILSAEGQHAAAEALMEGYQANANLDALDAMERQYHLLGSAGFHLRAGDTSAGIADLEDLQSRNAGFKLRNGVTLPAMLAHAYYMGAMEQLTQDGAEALRLAIEWFELAEKTGNPKAADVNHGKALAYLRLGKGQEANVARELEAIQQKDPAYFRRINMAR